MGIVTHRAGGGKGGVTVPEKYSYNFTVANVNAEVCRWAEDGKMKKHKNRVTEHKRDTQKRNDLKLAVPL